MNCKHMAKCVLSHVLLFTLVTSVLGSLDEEELDNTIWRREQAKHKSKTLKTSKLTKVASMSDKRHFETALLRPMLIERVVDTPGNAQVRQHILNQMKSLGWHVEEDSFTDDTPLGPKHFTNIIATHNVNAPRRLTLVCHYDSKYFSDKRFVGMTDSAVPCAMMMDLALKLNTSLWEPRDSKAADITLQLLFLDGEEAFINWSEEDSVYGARHLAQLWQHKTSKVSREVTVTENQRMDAFILLDLIGYANPTFRNWFPETSHLFERLKKIETRLAREKLLQPESLYSAKSSKFFVGNVMGYSGIEDDHIPFLQNGVPVLHLIAYPFPPVWHLPNDDIQNFDPESVNNLNIILRVFVAEYLHLNP